MHVINEPTLTFGPNGLNVKEYLLHMRFGNLAYNLHCIFSFKGTFSVQRKSVLGMYSKTSNLHSNLSLLKSDCKRKAVGKEEHGQLVQNLIINVKRLVKIGDVKSRFCCTY